MIKTFFSFLFNNTYSSATKVIATKPLLVFTESQKWLKAQYVHSTKQWFDTNGSLLTNVLSWTEVDISSLKIA